MSVSEGAVNRNPSQLLRFFGLSGPDAPSRLADFIQGGVNLLPWWLTASEQTFNQSASPGVGVLGAVSTITVPADQRWIVTKYTFYTPNPIVAAHLYRLQCVTTEQGQLFGLGPPVSAAGGELLLGDAFNGRGRDAWTLLAPGESISTFIAQNVGATPGQINVRIKFVSFTP